MTNLYTAELQRLVSQPTHKLNEIGDQWCTPDWLFCALDALYGPLVVDLFTDGQNSKCPVYFTADDNALQQDWGAAIKRSGHTCRLCDGSGFFYGDSDLGPCLCAPAKAFANPPYSIKRASKGRKAAHVTGMTHIMQKAYEEHLQGVPSVWLVKSATSEGWWPYELFTQVIHINGRIAFDLPSWYEPDIEEKDPSGAGFGASIILFDGESRDRKPEEYITRRELIEIGLPIAKERAEARQAWRNRFSGL
jgi:phage N-6-adenine-methyltransferase